MNVDSTNLTWFFTAYLLKHKEIYLFGSFQAQVEIESKKIHIFLLEEWILEAKTECYGKDRLFVASFVCFVITFEPIMI